MSPRATRIIRASLTKKGFEEDPTHHCMFWLVVNGKDTGIKTRFSHGANECNDWALGQMAKQVCLARKDFDNLIDCKLGKESYVQLLRTNGNLTG